MKIKTEAPDNCSSSRSEKTSPSPAKCTAVKQEKAEVKVKVEKSETKACVKSENASESRVCVKKESISDLTTHKLKSEVKLENGSDGVGTNGKKSSEAEGRKKNPTVSRKRKKTTTRKKKKKRTTRKKCTSKGVKKKGKKRKIVRCNKALVVSGARARLAAKIGMIRKKVLGPHSLPLINKPRSELPPVRPDILPPLSILGHGLSSFGQAPVIIENSIHEDYAGESQTLLAMPSNYTTSRLCDLKAGIIPHPLEEIRLGNDDLLGSILERQQLLLSRSEDLVVSSDGRLSLVAGSRQSRKQASTSETADGKSCKSPPPKTEHPETEDAVIKSETIASDSQVTAGSQNISSILPNGDGEKNERTVRYPAVTCGMPLKKRKFESPDLSRDLAKTDAVPNNDSEEKKPLPEDPVTLGDNATQPKPLVHEVKNESIEKISPSSLSQSITSRLNEVPVTGVSIEIKSVGMRQEKESALDSAANRLSEKLATKEADSKHRFVVVNKVCKDVIVEADISNSNNSQLKLEKQILVDGKHQQSDKHESTRSKIVVKSEVRDEKRSRDRSPAKDKVHRSHHKKSKRKDEVQSRRKYHIHDEETKHERPRSHSTRKEQSRTEVPRKSSRFEDEAPYGKGTYRNEREFRSSSNNDTSLSREPEWDRNSRRHRYPEYQNRQEDDRNKREDRFTRKLSQSGPVSDSRSYSSSKSYSKKQHQDVFSKQESHSKRTSGPKTPPDVHKSRSGSNDSAPTPTLDETDSMEVEPSNGSIHPLSKRPVPSQSALNNIKDYLKSETPLFASPKKVSSSSRLQLTSRPDSFASRVLPNTGKTAVVPSQISNENELDSGTNQVAIKQLLQSMLLKSKNVTSPAALESPYSPAASPICSPTTEDATSNPSSFQTLIDQILKSAQLSHQASSSSATSHFKKPHLPSSKSDSIREEKMRKKADIRKLLSGSCTASSADVADMKEKYLDKLNRQERVIEEVKLVLKPFYHGRELDKAQYKEIMRKAVPKICHNKSQEINPTKIKALVEKYIKRMGAERKKTSHKSAV